jgi:hypothetical protein
MERLAAGRSICPFALSARRSIPPISHLYLLQPSSDAP